MLQRHGFEIQKISYNSDPLSIPMSLYIACGGIIPKMPVPLKIFLAAIDLCVKPLAWILDVCKVGDCIEIHAVKVR